MSASHEEMQDAVHARALTLLVRSSAGTFAASATGGDNGRSAYTRATGSFLTDGLLPGMEASAAGFGSSEADGPSAIVHCTPTVCTVHRTLPTVSAAADRLLTVGLPVTFVEEDDEPFTPVRDVPYVEETWIPGPSGLTSLDIPSGALQGRLDISPQYVLRLGIPSGVGRRTTARYVDALLKHFKSGTTLVLESGVKLRVRADAGPFANTLTRQASRPGFTVTSVTIPLRCHPINT